MLSLSTPTKSEIKTFLSFFKFFKLNVDKTKFPILKVTVVSLELYLKYPFSSVTPLIPDEVT